MGAREVSMEGGKRACVQIENGGAMEGKASGERATQPLGWKVHGWEQSILGRD